jgi:hypothetical protein
VSRTTAYRTPATEQDGCCSRSGDTYDARCGVLLSVALALTVITVGGGVATADVLDARILALI